MHSSVIFPSTIAGINFATNGPSQTCIALHKRYDLRTLEELLLPRTLIVEYSAHAGHLYHGPIILSYVHIIFRIVSASN